MLKLIMTMIIGLLSIATIASALEVDMQRIVMIESSGNELAINKVSGARGLCQIMPCVLKEYNDSHDKKYSKKDLLNGGINLIIANWYINKRIPKMMTKLKVKDNLESRLSCYNQGIGNHKKGRMPKETRDYIKKYKSFIGAPFKHDKYKTFYLNQCGYIPDDDKKYNKLGK